VTLEELTAAFNAHKAKSEKDVADLLAANTAKDDEINRIKKHSSRLLADLKKAKIKTRAPVEDDEDDDEDGGGNTSGNDGDALARVQAQHQKEIDALKKSLDAKEQAANNALIDAALETALTKANVSSKYRTAATAMLKASRKIEVVDGTVRIDGKAASDSVSEWAATDEGSAFVVAPANGGSAAQGAPSGGGNTEKPRSAMTSADKGRLIREKGLSAFQGL